MGNVINFDIGIKEYAIPGLNGDYTVRINPTDLTFVERVFSVFEQMDAKQEEYDKLLTDAKDTKDVFEIYHRFESEMRGMINGVFRDENAAEGIFGKENEYTVFALAGGLPLWTNLMLALIDECDERFTKEKKATNPRIQKYIDKFNKSK